MFTLKFGPRLPRARPLRNAQLDEESRLFESRLSVFIENASWRLDEPDGPLCSSMSSNLDGGEMLRGLDRLRGATLTSFRLEEVGLDLVLKFDEGLVLRVLSDCMSEADGDNYSIFGHHSVYVASPGGILSTEVREPAPDARAAGAVPGRN